jgi:hypothetical protein
VLPGAVPDLADRRVIDPDLAKEYLAAWCVDQGLYGTLLESALPGGQPLLPLDLSPLVHTMSTAIANAVRRESLSRGEDVVIAATMSSGQFADRLMLSLAKAAYSELLIVSVETDRATAHERAKQRWWEARVGGGLGGRLVRPDVIDLAYRSSDTISACRANATALVSKVRAGKTNLSRASMVIYDDAALDADSSPLRACRPLLNTDHCATSEN